MNRKELREKNEYTAKKNKIRDQIYSRISYIDGMIDKEVEKEIEQKHFMYVNTSLYSGQKILFYIQALKNCRQTAIDILNDVINDIDDIYDSIVFLAEKDPAIIRNVKESIQTKTLRKNRFYENLVADIEKKAKETGNTEIVTMIENFNKVEL